jgi:P4 family phage/plasmid primase-like protien
MAAPNFANIPQELKRRAQWVLWKTITRAGKPTKVPYRPTGTEGDSSDPASWSTYEAVVESYHRGGYDGIGYVFDPLDPYAGIDLDDCINPDGSIKPTAKTICDSLDSYAEISPSGRGIKIFLKAKNPVNIQKKDGKFQQGFASKKPDLEIEIYYGSRFFTLTGNRLDDYPPTIEDRNSILTALFKSLFRDRGYFGDEVRQSEPTARTTIARLGTVSPEGGKRFAQLLKADPGFADAFTTAAPVGKRSDVEFALCARLWEAGIDEADIHILMDSSPQGKWQERDGNYRHETIRKAVAKSKASHEKTPTGPTVIDAINALAGVCDGAATKDGCGFSRFDRETHNDLIEKALSTGDLSQKEEKKAYAFLKKYKKQLKGLGTDYDQIGHINGGMCGDGNKFGEINDRIPAWIAEHHFKTVTDTEKLYHYASGVYLDDGEVVLKTLIEAEFGDITDNKMVSDVIGKVKRRTYVDRDHFNNRRVINVKNGLLDLETLQLQPHTPDYLSTAQIDVVYDPVAKAPNIAKFLQEVAQSGDVALIEEIIGWLLWPDYHVHKAIMLVGPGRNGKGTLLRLITAFMGRKSISNVTLQDLISDTFAKSDLYGKLANIGGDLPAKDLSDTSAFRNLTGGDDNRAQEKYRPAFNFRNKAKMLFSANVLPRSQDDTYAFYSRWILLEFLNRFVLDDGSADPNLDEKLQTPEELSGLLNIALNGLKRLRANGWKFSYTKTAEDVERMYKRNANPVYAFLEDDCEMGGATDYIEKSVFFAKFNNYVEAHHIRPISVTKFGELLKDQTEIPVSTFRPWVDRGDRPMCWQGVKFKELLTHPPKTPEKGEKTENKTGSGGDQSTPSILGPYSTNPQEKTEKGEENKINRLVEVAKSIDGVDCDSPIAVSNPAKKAHLWNNIQTKMKKYARSDKDRRGLAVSDLSPEEIEVVEAAGWSKETNNAGISILWAPRREEAGA